MKRSNSKPNILATLLCVFAFGVLVSFVASQRSTGIQLSENAVLSSSIQVEMR